MINREIDKDELVLKLEEFFLMKKIIFDEIDEAIEKCKTKKPVNWDKSKFKKLYEEIKTKWLR